MKNEIKKRTKRFICLFMALILAVTVFSVGFSFKPTISSADTSSNELESLKNNIDNYEKMMDGTTIYNNMEPAYEAYCAACEAYYENYYGYDYEDGETQHTYSSTEVNNANLALVEAMSDMTVFEGYEGQVSSAADGSYSTSSLAQKGDSYNYYVTNHGDDYSSTELYDEMSGLLYTYGVGSGSEYYGPSLTASGRIDGEDVNTGLEYGSVVFFYTGENHENDDSEGNNVLKQTTTYAVPINLYINANGGYLDRATVTFFAIDASDNSNISVNNDIFQLHRAWHGHIEGAQTASTYVTIAGNALGNNGNNYYVQFFGHDYTSSTASYSGLGFRSYNKSGMTATYYSNTMYYTGKPSDTTANSTVNTYYTIYDMLDYNYYNVMASEYVFIRPNRSNANVSYQQAQASNDAAVSSGNSGSFMSVSGTAMDSAGLKSGNARSYIYVIDYDSVLTAMETYKLYYNMYNGGSDGYTYYRQNNNNAMSNFLSAFDKLTAIDPNNSDYFNSSSDDIAGQVVTLSTTLENAVDAVKSASEVLDNSYDTITYSKLPVKQLVYDDTTYKSDKYVFTNANGDFCTDIYSSSPSQYTVIMGNYEYVEYYSSPTTAKGTVGGPIYGFEWDMTDHLYNGYDFDTDVTKAYYSASTGGFLNDVEVSFSPYSSTQTSFNVVPYSKVVTFYAFHATMDINLNIVYAVKGDDNEVTEIKTIDNADKIEYYKTSIDFSQDNNENVPAYFTTDTSKYVKTDDPVEADYEGDYEQNENEIQFTWNDTYAYNKSNSTSTTCNVYVYYEPVAVTVQYMAYSVQYNVSFDDESNQEEDDYTRDHHIVGESENIDGLIKLYDASVDANSATGATESLSETVTDCTAETGATAVRNGEYEGETFVNSTYFVGWYLLDHEAESYADFTEAHCLSTSISYKPASLTAAATESGLSTLSSLDNWTVNTVYYLYAVFTEDIIETEHITVEIMADDEYELEANTPFLITIVGVSDISSSEHVNMTTLAYTDASGMISQTFDMREGIYSVTVKSVDGLTVVASEDYSNVTVDTGDNTNPLCIFTISETTDTNNTQSDSNYIDNVFSGGVYDAT